MFLFHIIFRDILVIFLSLEASQELFKNSWEALLSLKTYFFLQLICKCKYKTDNWKYIMSTLQHVIV